MLLPVKSIAPEQKITEWASAIENISAENQNSIWHTITFSLGKSEEYANMAIDNFLNYFNSNKVAHNQMLHLYVDDAMILTLKNMRPTLKIYQNIFGSLPPEKIPSYFDIMSENGAHYINIRDCIEDFNQADQKIRKKLEIAKSAERIDQSIIDKLEDLLHKIEYVNEFFQLGSEIQNHFSLGSIWKDIAGWHAKYFIQDGYDKLKEDFFDPNIVAEPQHIVKIKDSDITVRGSVKPLLPTADFIKDNKLETQSLELAYLRPPKNLKQKMGVEPLQTRLPVSEELRQQLPASDIVTDTEIRIDKASTLDEYITKDRTGYMPLFSYIVYNRHHTLEILRRINNLIKDKQLEKAQQIYKENQPYLIANANSLLHFTDSKLIPAGLDIFEEDIRQESLSWAGPKKKFTIKMVNNTDTAQKLLSASTIDQYENIATELQIREPYKSPDFTDKRYSNSLVTPLLAPNASFSDINTILRYRIRYGQPHKIESATSSSDMNNRLNFSYNATFNNTFIPTGRNQIAFMKRSNVNSMSSELAENFLYGFLQGSSFAVIENRLEAFASARRLTQFQKTILMTTVAYLYYSVVNPPIAKTEAIIRLSKAGVTQAFGESVMIVIDALALVVTANVQGVKGIVSLGGNILGNKAMHYVIHKCKQMGVSRYIVNNLARHINEFKEFCYNSAVNIARSSRNDSSDFDL